MRSVCFSYHIGIMIHTDISIQEKEEVSPAAAAPAAEKAAAEEKAVTAAVEKATVGTEAGWGGGGETEQP